MRVFQIIAVVIGCTSTMVASAPSTVSGLVYRETLRKVFGPSRASTTTRFLLLQPDGRYSGLYQTSTSLVLGTSAVSKPFQTIPADGMWSYRKVGDAAAEITVDSITYPVTFTSDTDGSTETRSLTFSFSPYDASAQLANCSNRSFVTPGRSVSTGFIIASGERRVLLRAVGPTLQVFGITDALRRPVLKVTRVSTKQVVGMSAGWSTSEVGLNSPAQGLSIASQRAGAFPLPLDSSDSVLFLSLTADAYVAEVNSSDSSDTGQVLIEIYILP